MLSVTVTVLKTIKITKKAPSPWKPEQEEWYIDIEINFAKLMRENASLPVSSAWKKHCGVVLSLDF